MMLGQARKADPPLFLCLFQIGWRAAEEVNEASAGRCQDILVFLTAPHLALIADDLARCCCSWKNNRRVLKSRR
ncbi:hypothetical protein BDZ88DRAFT_424947 [Geranomyces variabilis]|nr:hypothetical protein BDZ88DRAFT_424947 [Geranomyces variabilis]